MKKHILLFFLLMLGTGISFSNQTIEDPYDHSSFSFDSIQYWIGEGENQAALLIDWYDGKASQSALVWGYRWPKDSLRHGFDMIQAIAEADENFFFLSHSTNLGSTVAGIGYNLNRSGEIALIFDNDSENPIYPDKGMFTTTSYDYDSWKSTDEQDHWQAGWYQGYWSYQVKNTPSDDFSYSGLGASSRPLVNGSCDAWSYQDFSSSDSYGGSLPRMPFVYVKPPFIPISSLLLSDSILPLYKGRTALLSAQTFPENASPAKILWSSSDSLIAGVNAEGLIQAKNTGECYIFIKAENQSVIDSCLIQVKQMDYSQGVFFVNEDWFGHNNGSINFLDSAGNWHYRVYQAENPGKELGASSQYATVYGDKLFIVSKQAQDPGSEIKGSRLVVCDAKTMKSIAEFPELGDADGRSFLGVDLNKAYISSSNGIHILNLKNMTIDGQVKGSENESGSLYSGQVGNMLRVGERVFAVHQQKGLLLIDPNTDSLQSIIGAPLENDKQRGFGSIVLSKDGNLWISVASNTSGTGASEDLILKLNPYTLDTNYISLPKGSGIPNSWYAWTADGFCASTQNNKIYWKNNAGWFNSSKIYEYDIDQDSLHVLIDLQDIEQTKDWGIYGAGFRLDPITDDIYISLFKSFGESSYQVAKFKSENGALESIYPLENHYWFPALSVFPDQFAPLSSAEKIEISSRTKSQVYLGDLVSDADHLRAAIVKSITSISDQNIVDARIQNDSLVILPKGEIGKAEIKLLFNSNGKIASKNISFEFPEIKIDSIFLDTLSLSLYVGQSYALEASFLPEDADNKNLFWESSQTSIASVDVNGLLTAIDTGQTIITVSSPDGEISAYCTVNVLKPLGIETLETELCEVYPSVSSHLVYLRHRQNIGNVEILNMSGKLIDKLYFTSSKASIDLSSYSSGIYFLRIHQKAYKVIKP